MIRECAALLFYVPAAAVQWWGAPETSRAFYKMSVMMAASGSQVLMSARMSLYSCWLFSLAAALAFLKLFSVCKETKKKPN